MTWDQLAFAWDSYLEHGKCSDNGFFSIYSPAATRHLSSGRFLQLEFILATESQLPGTHTILSKWPHWSFFHHPLPYILGKRMEILDCFVHINSFHKISPSLHTFWPLYLLYRFEVSESYNWLFIISFENHYLGLTHQCEIPLCASWWFN